MADSSVLDPTTVLLGGAVLLCVLWCRRPPSLPPSPGCALPLVGHLHLMSKDPRVQFIAWRRQYGDVYSLYMGRKLVVVLASYSAIREALVTFADVFSDRPHDFLIAQLADSEGIAATSGPKWKEQRDASYEVFRQMAMGKNVLAEKIQEEITHYIRAIKDRQGTSADLVQVTKVSIFNNVCSIMLGKRFQYQDPEFLHFVEVFNKLFKSLSGSNVLNFIPVLRYIPGDPFGGQQMKTSSEQIYRFVEKYVTEHKTEEKGEHQENIDFIDGFLRQIELRDSSGEQTTSVNDKSLQKVVGDIFAAGTETASSGILWAMLFFLHHPHVQDKCFNEISEVIRSHRVITLNDKQNLPYLEATILEILRKGEVAPVGILHATASDCAFRDFIIPKDTVVIPALTCTFADPDIWGDPENFRPERFIGDDGKLKHLDNFIPFGLGRRTCLGEALARMELFLYLAALIQNFRFLPSEDGRLPPLTGTFGLAHTPHPFQIRAVPRNVNSE